MQYRSDHKDLGGFQRKNTKVWACDPFAFHYDGTEFTGKSLLILQCYPIKLIAGMP